MWNQSRINIKLITRFVGVMLMVLGCFMALCIPCALWYNEGDAYPLSLSALITSSLGLMLRISAWKIDIKNITNRDAYLIVSIGWLALVFAGALPYLFSGVISDIPGAVFESVSGLTTTGATVLRDIESVSHGILFWRSLSQWLGGMGFVMLTLTLIPMLGTGGLKVMASDILDLTAEKPGRSFISSIRWLWVAYTSLTIITAVAYYYGGMTTFDAICHAFTTLSTGGFSTRNGNIAEFGPGLQYIIMFFMFLAGANFPLVVKAVSGKPLRLLKSEELRYYLYLVVGVSVLIASLLIILYNTNVETALRLSFFQVISFISTTGYVVTDYSLWAPPLWLILFMLMLTGSCSGSAGGGLKVMRQMIMFKNTSNTIKSVVHPNAVFAVRVDGKIINEDIIYNVLAYYFMYLIVFAAGAFSISIIGIDFKTSVGIAAASIGNIGPGIGDISPFPVYDTFPAIGKWLVSILMLIGRLEMFAILILFSSAFWKK